jgi:hypothetical protein
VTRPIRRQESAAPGPEISLTGMLHPLSIGVALGGATLVGQVQSWVAWPLGGLCGIALYLLLVGLEYALVSALLAAEPRTSYQDDEIPGG